MSHNGSTSVACARGRAVHHRCRDAASALIVRWRESFDPQIWFVTTRLPIQATAVLLSVRTQAWMWRKLDQNHASPRGTQLKHSERQASFIIEHFPVFGTDPYLGESGIAPCLPVIIQQSCSIATQKFLCPGAPSSTVESCLFMLFIYVHRAQSTHDQSSRGSTLHRLSI